MPDDHNLAATNPVRKADARLGEIARAVPAAQPSPENSWRVPIPVQTQEPPYGTSAVLTTTCATTEALV